MWARLRIILVPVAAGELPSDWKPGGSVPEQIAHNAGHGPATTGLSPDAFSALGLGVSRLLVRGLSPIQQPPDIAPNWATAQRSLSAADAPAGRKSGQDGKRVVTPGKQEAGGYHFAGHLATDPVCSATPWPGRECGSVFMRPAACEAPGPVQCRSWENSTGEREPPAEARESTEGVPVVRTIDRIAARRETRPFPCSAGRTRLVWPRLKGVVRAGRSLAGFAPSKALEVCRAC